MKNGRMQAKDVPDETVLRHLANHQGHWCMAYGPEVAEDRSIHHGFPPGTPEKVMMAKMRSLIRRGMADGCCCGCRGDFEITNKGLAYISQERGEAMINPTTEEEWAGYMARWIKRNSRPARE